MILMHCFPNTAEPQIFYNMYADAMQFFFNVFNFLTLRKEQSDTPIDAPLFKQNCINVFLLHSNLERERERDRERDRERESH